MFYYLKKDILTMKRGFIIISLKQVKSNKTPEHSSKYIVLWLLHISIVTYFMLLQHTFEYKFNFLLSEEQLNHT